MNDTILDVTTINFTSVLLLQHPHPTDDSI